MAYLIGELPDALEGGPAIDGNVVLVEERDQLLVLADALADALDGRVLALLQRHARALDLLEHVDRARVRLHAVIAVAPRVQLLEDERVVGAVALQVDALAALRHRHIVNDGDRGLARFPREPRAAQNLRHRALPARPVNYRMGKRRLDRTSADIVFALNETL